MAANPQFDLIDLAFLKAWITSSATFSAVDDTILQAMITGASSYWLWKTNRGNPDGTIPTKSPFVQPVSYSESYDGSGSFRQFIRNTPIVSISLLKIGFNVIPQSAGYGSGGWVIDSNGRSISLRPGATNISFSSAFGSGMRFSKGVQNVQLAYMAGFNGVPPDIQEACAIMIATTYKRRGYVDQASVSLPEGGGTTSYRKWETPPEVLSVMQAYSGVAVI